MNPESEYEDEQEFVSKRKMKCYETLWFGSMIQFEGVLKNVYYY